MSQLKVASIRDLTDARGFSLSGGGISAIGTLTVGNININGQIQGQSTYVIPPQTGNSGKFLSSNGSGLSWQEVSTSTGIRSMQVWTSNGTWSRPSGVKTILVTVTGAGGGGSGFAESGGAGGTSERTVVSQTSPVSVLLLVTQVAVQIILVVGAVVTLVPSVVTVVRQADMVLTVGNSMQGVLEAMGLEER